MFNVHINSSVSVYIKHYWSSDVHFVVLLHYSMDYPQRAKFIPSQKGGRNVQDENNFVYRKLRENRLKTKISYKCVKCDSLKCPAVAWMDIGSNEITRVVNSHKAGSLKMNTALEYSTRVVQEGGRRCKKSTLNDLVHLTPLRIPLMNPPIIMVRICWLWRQGEFS